jgi:hypothetical protein
MVESRKSSKGTIFPEVQQLQLPATPPKHPELIHPPSKRTNAREIQFKFLAGPRTLDTEALTESATTTFKLLEPWYEASKWCVALVCPVDKLQL